MAVKFHQSSPRHPQCMHSCACRRLHAVQERPVHKRRHQRNQPARQNSKQLQLSALAAGGDLNQVFGALSSIVPSLQKKENVSEEELVQGVMDYINELTMVLKFEECLSALYDSVSQSTSPLPSPSIRIEPL